MQVKEMKFKLGNTKAEAVFNAAYGYCIFGLDSVLQTKRACNDSFVCVIIDS